MGGIAASGSSHVHQRQQRRSNPQPDHLDCLAVFLSLAVILSAGWLG